MKKIINFISFLFVLQEISLGKISVKAAKDSGVFCPQQKGDIEDLLDHLMIFS